METCENIIYMCVCVRTCAVGMKMRDQILSANIFYICFITINFLNFLIFYKLILKF